MMNEALDRTGNPFQIRLSNFGIGMREMVEEITGGQKYDLSGSAAAATYPAIEAET